MILLSTTSKNVSNGDDQYKPDKSVENDNMCFKYYKLHGNHSAIRIKR